MIIGYCDTVGEWETCHNKLFVTISQHFTVVLDQLMYVKTVTISNLSQYTIITAFLPDRRGGLQELGLDWHFLRRAGPPWASRTAPSRRRGCWGRRWWRRPRTSGGQFNRIKISPKKSCKKSPKNGTKRILEKDYKSTMYELRTAGLSILAGQ